MILPKSSAAGWLRWGLILLGCHSLGNNHSHLADACTVFLVGKDASADGSVMCSHSNDGEFDTDPRLVKVPAADYPPGAMRPVFYSPESYPRYVGTDRGLPEYYPRDDEPQHPAFEPIGHIPQVGHTFAYLEETYGAVNEMQVGIGESTCSGVFGARPVRQHPNGTALLSIDELSKIAMERASTARQAVRLMGDLAVAHGFYGAGEFEGTAESLAVTDPKEAWIFHILPDPTGRSAIWAAQRIGDDQFAVIANMFVIREVDPGDEERFLMSDSVHEVAREYGWWNPREGLLDFTKVYSDGEYAHKYYSGRRMWSAYRLAAESQEFPTEYGDLQSDPVYPLSTKPDALLTERDLFRFHRDTMRGTPFDLSAEGNLAGGPFGTPDRWKEGPNEARVGGNWERAIGLYRTSDTYVVQSKEAGASSMGAVLWFGPSSALATVFTPFLVSMEDVPSSFRSGHQSVFSRDSAFWAACYVHNLANLKWSYMIRDITKRQDELETASVELVEALRQTLLDQPTPRALELAHKSLTKNADSIVRSLWSLADELMFRYADGFRNHAESEIDPSGEITEVLGYPEWWLKAVGYQDGPPPPPTKPKCCNPPKKPPATIASALETTSKAKPKLRRVIAEAEEESGKDNDDDDVRELYITQRLDHFDTTNPARFQQRYFVSYRHSKQSDIGGKASRSSASQLPTISLLCVGGEGPGFTKNVLIDSVHCSGDMLELAKRIAETKTHNVVLYALEHRYYGNSYPDFTDPETGNPASPLSVSNLRFLSSRQALEDLAHFVHTVNKETDAYRNTWVTFGGSYPGLMSMYARYKYPHLVFASVSSSAPLQLKVDFPGYKERQGWDLKYDKIGGSEECHRIVKAGHDQAVALLQQSGNATDDGPVVLAKKFNVCNPDTALKKRRNQELFLGDGLINIMSQGNDPSCTEGELCNIAGLCRFMIQQVEEMKTDGNYVEGNKDDGNVELEVLAKTAQKQMASNKQERQRRGSKRNQLALLETLSRTDDDCISVEYDDMITFLASEEVEPSGSRSWTWQTCTEFGFYQTCDDNCPFASNFHSIDMDLEMCSRLFNISGDDVYENVQASIDRYGGKGFLESGASNILTVNGNVDPWSVLGLEESDSTRYSLPVKMVKGASHHFWTHAVKDTDAIEIIKIREYIYSCVMNWLGINQLDERTNMNAKGAHLIGDESGQGPLLLSPLLRKAAAQ